MVSMTRVQPGHVTLIAAGSANPDLLPLRAVRILQRASHVIADLDAVKLAEGFVTNGAQVQVAVDQSGLPLEQATKSKTIVDTAKTGVDVVVLLAGDPVLNGSFAREVQSLSKAKLSFDFIPAPSTLTATAGFAGIGLFGGKSNEVRIFDMASGDVDYSQLVDSKCTIVMLHAAERAAEIAKGLLKAGRAEETPIMVVRDGATVDQRSLVSTLQDLPSALKTHKITGDGMVFVGDVVAKRNALSWFEAKPLFGWRILVPRTKDNLGPAIDLLIEVGATVTEVPTVTVEQPRTPQQMERAVHSLVSGRFAWIIFTSHNSVRAVWERCVEYGLDARAFAGLKIAATGEGTVNELMKYGIKADLEIEEDLPTSAILEVFPEFDEILDPLNRIFIPRADIATESLSAGLVELGWEVEDVTAYRTVRAAPPAADIRDAIKTGGYDAVLFTSASTVRNLVGIAGKPHPGTVIACIGPQTAKTCEEHGLRVDVLAAEPQVEVLVDALIVHGAALRDTALEQGEFTWRPSRRRNTVRRKVT
jgi:uroporphyrinogen III methyltransferase/synthase